MKSFLTYKLFNLEQIKVFSTTRKIGSVKTNHKLNWKNLEKAMKLNNLQPKNLVMSQQIHGSKIAIIKSSTPNLILGKDGLITKKGNIFLGVASADCIPLVFYCPDKRILGVFHAGYKGILRGIISEIIAYFRTNTQSLENIKVLLGPSICPSCYEVDKKIIDEFSKTFSSCKNFYFRKKDKYFLDLKSLVRENLITAGFSKRNIGFSALCTNENSSFLYSARKSKNKNFGEFATIAGMI